MRADAAQQEHIAEFVHCYLSDCGRRLAASASVGYIPFHDTVYDDAVYDLALAKFEAGATGTVFGGDNAYRGAVAEGLVR